MRGRYRVISAGGSRSPSGRALPNHAFERLRISTRGRGIQIELDMQCSTGGAAHDKWQGNANAIGIQ